MNSQPAAEMLEARALLSAGSLDVSFDNDGIVTTNFIPVTNTPGWSDSASSIALQGDGKMVVAGTIQPNGGPMGAISRYNTDGSLDTTFATGGKISDVRFNTLQDVAVQSDGKIVVVGRAYPMNGAAGNFAMGRFNADGSPDATFGANGIVVTNPGVYDTAYAVSLLDDGKILVTGQSGQPGPEQPYGFTVQKFNSDGTIDTLFGIDGKVRTFYSTAEIGNGYARTGNVGGRDLAVQPDGKIIVAGHSLNGDSLTGFQNGFAAVRYNVDGSLDTSFDTDGRVYTNLGSGQHWVTSVSLQADGKVIVGGYLIKLSPVVDADFALVRYNTDGSLDTTFDGDGKLIVERSATQDYINDVKIQSDGAIVVTGSVGNLLAVSRFNPDGSSDAAFGNNGLVTTAVQASASGSKLIVQPDGAIVVAGTVNNGNGNQFLNRDFVVARYNGLSPVAVSIAAANDASETGSVAGKFTVTLNAATTVDTVVSYSVLASSTTTVGADYATLSGTVIIPAGSTSADIIVSGIANDLIVESNETISIQLTGSTAGTSVINTGSDTATISVLDNDSATVSIGNASVTEGNSGTTVLSFPVTLSNSVDVAVSVDYTTQDGTAIAGSDYVAQSGTLTIPAGSTTGTIDITVHGDSVIELDETFSVILSSVQASGRDVAIGVNELTPGVVQLDASTLGLASGTVVSSWSGQTSGGTPTLLTGQTPNGGAAVQFNAGGDRLGDNVFVPASAAGDFIYVAVVKANNIGAYHNLVDDDAQNRPMLWIDGSFNYELNFSGGGGSKAAGTGPGGWDIVIMDSRLNQLYVNSATPNASGGAGIAYTSGRNFDFFHRDGGQTFQGLVAEARIYNDRAVFGGNFAALYSELQTKWFGSGLGSSVGVGTIVNDDFNTAPVAVTDAAATDEANTFTFSVLGNDTDAENNIVASLTTAISSPAAGLLTDNGNGSFTFNPNGAFEALAAGESAQVSFNYKIEDAYGETSTATVTITIDGVNDVATISGNATGGMTEDDAGTGGVLAVSDVDNGQSGFVPQTNLAGAYGTFSIDASGNWSYTRTADLNAMTAIGGLSDSFTVVCLDGTASQTVTITITPVNDAPVIVKAASGGVTAVTTIQAYNTPNAPGNGGFNSTYGGLPGGQVDGREISGFAAGDVVTFTISGVNYLFTLFDGTNNPLAPFAGIYSEMIPGGMTASYTVTGGADTTLRWFLQGNPHTGGNPFYTVTASAVSGGLAANEDTATLLTGLSVSDVDAGSSELNVTLAVQNGSLALLSSNGLSFTDNDGSDGTLAFTGTESNINAALAALQYTGDFNFNGQDALQIVVNDQGNTGADPGLTGDANSEEATATFTITVIPVNDVATISGDNAGTITEDAAGTSGIMTVSDVDHDQNVFVTQTDVAGTYGKFSIDAAGNWSYTLTADLQSLPAGEVVTDGFSVVSADGTANQLVTVTINGVNDVATISGDSTGDMTEDDAGDSGVLAVSDVDNGQNVFQALTAVAGTCGTFSINAAGNWSYTRTSNLDAMNAGDALTDSFTVVSADGTDSKVVTVTITGVNDLASISGDNAGTLTEEGSGDSGVLTVTDLDDAENVFQPVTNVAGTYGTFSIDATGNWNYTRTANLQSLAVSESVVDSFTVVSLDGTASEVVTITITGENDAPVISGVVSSNATLSNASEYGVVTISGSFSDIDTSDTHSATINWGDGTSATVSVDQLADTLAGSHTYQNGGIYTITVTVDDGNGGTAISTTMAVVEGVGVVNGILYIIGTDGRDHIELKFNEKKNELKIDARLDQDARHGGCGGGGRDGDDRIRQTIAVSSISRVVAYLYAGDDHYDGGSDGDSDCGRDSDTGQAAISQFVFGGAGDDNIQGGRGDDVLSGGSGRDDIKGGSGADIIIGGTGKDNLKGGRDNDLIIGGSTANEEDLVALDQALAAWSSDDLTAALSFIGNVTDDNDKDDLFGDQGDDYLHYGNGDKRKN